VIVFGRSCHDVREPDALSYVAGFTIGNDFSARDLQTATPQIMLGKNSDGFGPIGPWLAPAGLVKNPNALGLRTYVNGALRQDWSTDDMIFSCRQLISFVSGLWTIHPGDVLFTGTPQGVIFGEERPPEHRDWLKAGDQIVSEIDGLGSLTVTLTETADKR
jgi:2-keto-4-pentenoate hydratase/2-oxohepta-3-ene-1,7-dioic acid hydratase in catechol pathway